jgi:D-alanyl-lipoteichoic acid acyltransferase DltB (MBOAT superfamily)
MIAFTLDIADTRFWLTAVLAIFALNAITESRLRSLAWAAANLGFLSVLLGSRILPLLAGLLIVHLCLHAIAADRGRRLPIKLAAATTLCLFLLHKLPFHAYQLRDFIDALFEIRFLIPALGAAMLMLIAWAIVRRRLQFDSLILLGAAWVVVALIRRYPPDFQQIEFDHARRVLGTIGFSYVALRLVEVFRAVHERQHAAPGFAALINYLVPFHMLGAGPIQAYSEFASQPRVPDPLTPLEVMNSLERIAFGLFKKYVLATSIQTLFLTDFATFGPYTFVEVQFFFLWLYLDFSAYTDIAVGVGRLMGVATPENFNRPYLARNMVDFWERWHISLSLFIRRNLYIPIFATLMRRGTPPHPLMGSTVAFTISFILCGLWHGLNVNFLLWGTIHALGLVIANAYNYVLQQRIGSRGMKTYRANPLIRAISTAVTYEFVAFSMLVLFFPR